MIKLIITKLKLKGCMIIVANFLICCNTFVFAMQLSSSLSLQETVTVDYELNDPEAYKIIERIFNPLFDTTIVIYNSEFSAFVIDHFIRNQKNKRVCCFHPYILMDTKEKALQRLQKKLKSDSDQEDTICYTFVSENKEIGQKLYPTEANIPIENICSITKALKAHFNNAKFVVIGKKIYLQHELKKIPAGVDIISIKLHKPVLESFALSILLYKQKRLYTFSPTIDWQKIRFNLPQNLPINLIPRMFKEASMHAQQRQKSEKIIEQDDIEFALASVLNLYKLSQPKGKKDKLHKVLTFRVNNLQAGKVTDEFAGKIPKKIQFFLRYVKDPVQYKKVVDNQSMTLLLHGPPGTGKTTMARGIARETMYELFAPRPAQFMSHFINKSSSNLDNLINELRKYAEMHETKVILFLDELDSLLPIRGEAGHKENDKVVSAFLNLVDGFEKKEDKLILIGATNFIESIDQAVLRRFDHHVQLKLPSMKSRQEIFEHYLKSRSKENEVLADLNKFAKMTDTFTGDDIHKVLNIAGNKAYEKDSINPSISSKHIVAAIKKYKKKKDPSISNISDEILRMYV